MKQFFGTRIIGEKEQSKALREVQSLVVGRATKFANFVQWREEYTLVYKRFASLFAVVALTREENELIALEFLQRYIEVLDSYFGNVCELDIIFNFEKAYYLLHELIVAGELADSSIDSCVKHVLLQDNPATHEQSSSPAVVVSSSPAASSSRNRSSSTNSSSIAGGAAESSSTGAAAERTKFEVEGTAVDGRRVPMTLVVGEDELRVVNKASGTIEKAWSYSKIKRWAAGPSSFTLDLGKVNSSQQGDTSRSSKYVSFTSSEGNAISIAVSKAHTKFIQKLGPTTTTTTPATISPAQ